MQDEPGGRGCFACKMSLERGSAMLGIDDQSEQQTGNERTAVNWLQSSPPAAGRRTLARNWSFLTGLPTWWQEPHCSVPLTRSRPHSHTASHCQTVLSLNRPGHRTNVPPLCARFHPPLWQSVAAAMFHSPPILTSISPHLSVACGEIGVPRTPPRSLPGEHHGNRRDHCLCRLAFGVLAPDSASRSLPRSEPCTRYSLRRLLRPTLSKPKL